MANTIYISQDVMQHSMFSTGDAIAAFVKWKPKRRETVFRYEKADIHITAGNGAIYLMSTAETTKSKIPFTLLPTAEIGMLVRSMSGAA